MRWHPGRRTTSAALAAAAVVAAVLIAPQQAFADPALPPNASEALKQYTALAHEAGKLNEDHLKAQEDLKAKQGELDRANADLTKATTSLDGAKADEVQFRGRVDMLTEASFEGARFTKLSAMLVSDSQQDFLNRMSAMDVLAADNSDAMGRLTRAVTAADKARATTQDAQTRATDATAAATTLLADIGARKSELDKQVDQARGQYRTLSAAEKAVLADKGDTSAVPVSGNTAGAAAAALEFALAQRGEPYVFGANGPDTWDCSSLMQAAYRSAGISIPRVTYTQATVGRQVSRGEARAGDLIIYYSGQSHVAMAVDNVRAVHASTEGVPVKIANINDIAPISVIRRVVG